MLIEEIPYAKLKGIGDGFRLTIDPSAPEALLKKEISELFKRLKHLSVNAKVFIDTADNDVDDEIFAKLENFLKAEFKVASVSLSQEKVTAPEDRIRQRDLARSWTNHKSDVLMLKGRVRSGQRIETRKHLVLMGDVNPGAELTAAGNIIVIGSLQGRASAGWPDDEASFLIALDFKPTQIRIGSVVASNFDGVLTGRAIYASVQSGKVCFEDYLKLKPFKHIPWPTAI